MVLHRDEQGDAKSFATNSVANDNDTPIKHVIIPDDFTASSSDDDDDWKDLVAKLLRKFASAVSRKKERCGNFLRSHAIVCCAALIISILLAMIVVLAMEAVRWKQEVEALEAEVVEHKDSIKSLLKIMEESNYGSDDSDLLLDGCWLKASLGPCATRTIDMAYSLFSSGSIDNSKQLLL